ncbi:hypothetical protein C8R45DRAFT_91834 [Mycena sanguinolenta]|nr:hypothetical protein C8R45DRAFT_91834 [Mycena sanguinolenta]
MYLPVSFRLDAVEYSIRSIPAPYVVVGRAWRHFIHAEGQNRGIMDLSHLIARWLKPPSLELIGAGGTRMNLASIVVSHIKDAMPTADTLITKQTLISLLGTIALLNYHGDSAFRGALLSRGIVAPLTTAVRALCHIGLPEVDVLLNQLFPALVRHIWSHPPTWITESLRAGLLETFFTYRDKIPLFARILIQVLPPITIYHSALMQFKISLSKSAPSIYGSDTRRRCSFHSLGKARRTDRKSDPHS